MIKKLKVAILFGGKSAEHEVSIQSAKNVYNALDKNKYDIVMIGINRDGQWEIDDIKKFDVIFPVLHGPFGEDGTIQGLLKTINLPFVGSDVLGSAIGMDKDVAKRLLKETKIPVVPFLTFAKSSKISFEQIVKKFGLPFFVKPANLGSSVGISKVHSENEFKQAIIKAFSYDNKILIEQYIKGREIECSVLGNDDPIASIPGEIIPSHEFYDYAAKYLDENGAMLKIPAELSQEIIKTIQKLAIKTFKTLCLQGMARVDFFLSQKNKLYVNEVNTIPGFTNISMYPKLWEASGMPQKQLLDRLIELALERHERQTKPQTTL
ncbi:MAG TPA: D-alanine--D-alanine ligase family protein [Patescibacteria group bacterium]|nr:D-alanine--D-alanine ligase family protein [Patescibacteria group bacterium]